MRKTKTLLLLILFLAAILRVYKLDQYPAGLNADEAAIGYNAYSLIMTGKDEHGNSWPIHFKSFGDYKPGLYFYLVLPFVRILGLNIWSVRLPSVIFGIISVWLIYLLIKELFNDEWLALTSAFFLAISPWHIHFSRGAWETNAATFFILAGVYFFFKALKNPKFFAFSFSLLVFSMYTYHAPRMVLPFLGFFLIVFYRKKILNNLKWTALSGIIGMVLLLPLLLSLIGPAGAARFSGVSIFSDIGPFWRINELRGEHANPNSWLVRLLHNRPETYLREFLQNYLDHFDGVFLFILGDRIKRSNSPDMGVMYLFDFIFLLAGFYFLLKIRPKHWLLPLTWLLLAPIPAALTFQTPNALRAHNMVIPLIIISSYGFYNFILLVKEKFSSFLFTLFSLLMIVLIFWNKGYFLRQYFIHYPQVYPEAWEYGFEELVSYLAPIKDKYSKIYVTEKYDQPYIIFLFYMRYPPEKFQKEVVLTPRDKFGFSTVRDFDKYHFESINWEKLKNEKNVLVVGTDEEIPAEVKITKTIYFPNNKPAFKIVDL